MQVLFKLKKIIRRLQEIAERRFVGGSIQAVLWRYRHFYKFGWAEGYLKTINHPHRQQLIEAVESFEPITNLLEIGCASGANLIRMRDRFPGAQLIGIDINSKAINVATKYFSSHGDRCVHLFNQSAEEIKFMKSKSVDVVITDAVLMFITPNKISSIISEILRISRKGIVLNEYHSDGLKDGHFISGRWVYDYVSIIRNELPQVEIKCVKSGFTGGVWDVYGTLIEVHL